VGGRRKGLKTVILERGLGGSRVPPEIRKGTGVEVTSHVEGDSPKNGEKEGHGKKRCLEIIPKLLNLGERGKGLENRLTYGVQGIWKRGRKRKPLSNSTILKKTVHALPPGNTPKPHHKKINKNK